MKIKVKTKAPAKGGGGLKIRPKGKPVERKPGRKWVDNPVPKKDRVDDVYDKLSKVDVHKFVEAAYKRIEKECVERLNKAVSNVWEAFKKEARLHVANLVQEGFGDAYREKVEAFVAKAEICATPVDVPLADIEKMASDGWHIVEIVPQSASYHHRKPGIYWQRFKNRGSMKPPKVVKSKNPVANGGKKFRLKFKGGE